MAVTRRCILIMLAVLLASWAVALALWLMPPRPAPPSVSDYGAQGPSQGAP